jgi:phosphate/sulfate permease
VYALAYHVLLLLAQNPVAIDKGEYDSGESRESQVSRHSSGIPASASGVKMANILLSFSRDDLHKNIASKSSSDIAMMDADNRMVSNADAEVSSVGAGPGGDGDGDGTGVGMGVDSLDLRQFHASSQFMKRKDALFCYKYLVVYVAALMSFAHGANDTANSTATFSAVYTIYQDGLTECDSDTAIWILVVAGACSSLGTIFLGYKVLSQLKNTLHSII